MRKGGILLVLVLLGSCTLQAQRNWFDLFEQAQRLNYAAQGTDKSHFDAFSEGLPDQLQGVGEVSYAAHLEAHKLWEPSGVILDSICSTESHNFVRFYAHYHSIFRYAFVGDTDRAQEMAEVAISLAKDSLKSDELYWLSLVELATNYDGLYEGVPALRWMEHVTPMVSLHPSPFLRYEFLTRRLSLLDGEQVANGVDLVSDEAFHWYVREGMYLKAAKVALNKTSLLTANHEYSEALTWFHLAEENMELSGCEACKCTLFHNRGYFYYQQEKVDSAFYWFEKGIDACTSCGDFAMMSYSYAFMGVLEYHDNDNRFGSDVYFRKAWQYGLETKEEGPFILSSEYLIDILADENADTINVYVDAMNAFQQEQLTSGAVARRALLQDTDFDVLQAKVDLEEANREGAELRAQRLTIIAIGLGLVATGIVLIGRIWLKRNKERQAAAEKDYQLKEELNQKQVTEMVARHRYESLVSGIKGEEQERERIAQELHDNIGGSLGIIAAQLGGSEDVSAAESGRLSDQLNSIYKDLRSLSHTLQLPDMSTNALVELSKALLDNLSKASGIATNLRIFPADSALNLPDALEVQLYRILQEVVNNALKHSEAKQLELSITRRPDAVVLIIEDDGKGFDPSLQSEGIGLQNMRQRAESVGGTLEIDAALGRGSIFTIEVPLNEE